jgi:NADH dehydrogenase FAD-containing subunit
VHGRHFGSLAYIGSERAVADFSGKVTLGGFGAWWLWRSIYWRYTHLLRNERERGRD